MFSALILLVVGILPTSPFVSGQVPVITGALTGDANSITCHNNLPQCTPGQPCGDLTVDGPRVQRTARVDTIQVANDSCAFLEGCTAPGIRTVLRFDMATPNVGDADVAIGSPGVPSLATCFKWSQCHAHYHFQGYGQYFLADESGTVVASGHKSSSCLQDGLRTPNTTAPELTNQELFTCASQGVHAGYQDVYGSQLDCQWIDVTDVPPGNYFLTVQVNQEGIIPELNWDNNAVTVPVVLPDGPRVPDPEPTTCDGIGGCNECTEQVGCGWCAGSGYCTYGTYEGPSTGYCGWWVWSEPQCGAPPPASLIANQSEVAEVDAAYASHYSSTAVDDTKSGTISTVSSSASPSVPSSTASVDVSDASSTGVAVGDASSTGTTTSESNPSGVSPTLSSTAPAVDADISSSSSTGSASISIVSSGSNDCPAGQVRVSRAVKATSICDQLTSCGSCADISGCGWCSATNKCSVGDASGSTESVCTGTWQYGATTNTCGNCEQFSGCDSCTAATDCGWCGSSKSCVSGSWRGPTTAICASDWSWSTKMCPAASAVSVTPATTSSSCSKASTCGECTAISGCGFCDSEMGGVEHLCVAGHFLGPNQGACKKWIWAQHTCPVSQTSSTSTSTGTSSKTIAKDPHAPVVTVTSKAPSKAVPKKVAPVDCTALDTCTDCARHSACGWCSSTNQCSAGSYTGSDTDSTCPASSWVWSTSSCVAPPPSAELVCASQTSCSSCANVRGCGWCASTNACQWGDFRAPSTGTCETWVWSAATCSSTMLTARLTGNAPGTWSPLTDDPTISADLKSWRSSLSDILKMDEQGNIFKSDPVNAGFKKDHFGNFLKNSTHVDIGKIMTTAATVTTPATTTAVQNKARTNVLAQHTQSVNPYGRRRSAVVDAVPKDSDAMSMTMDMSVTSSSQNAVDILPTKMYDMYDAYPMDPMMPHGHVEHIHMHANRQSLSTKGLRTRQLEVADNLDTVCVDDPSTTNSGVAGSTAGAPVSAPGQAVVALAVLAASTVCLFL